MDKNTALLLHEPLVVVNVGPREFAESLEQQGVNLIQVDWVPPAAGDQEMIDLLEDLL
jgi:DNA-binding TFAR19-related protein (PDSD5 family)